MLHQVEKSLEFINHCFSPYTLYQNSNKHTGIKLMSVTRVTNIPRWGTQKRVNKNMIDFFSIVGKVQKNKADDHKLDYEAIKSRQKDFYKLLSFGVDCMKNIAAKGILRLVNFQKSSLKQQCYML